MSQHNGMCCMFYYFLFSNVISVPDFQTNFDPLIIQTQNSLLLLIYKVLNIYDDMDTRYMYFSGTISLSYTLCT